MTIQQSPTYVGWLKNDGMWAFSPSPIKNADFVWNVSHWTFDDINELMSLPDDKSRLIRLLSQCGMPS